MSASQSCSLQPTCFNPFKILSYINSIIFNSLPSPPLPSPPLPSPPLPSPPLPSPRLASPRTLGTTWNVSIPMYSIEWVHVMRFQSRSVRYNIYGEVVHYTCNSQNITYHCITTPAQNKLTQSNGIIIVFFT